MQIESLLKEKVVAAVQALYEQEVKSDQVQVNLTPKNFEGHYSVIVFPFVRFARKKPEEVGQDIGAYLKENCIEVDDFNVVKGFCNLEIGDIYWKQLMTEALQMPNYGLAENNGQTVVVEYSSPNTNKPLHLGHIRNNLLGYAAAEILKAGGYNVQKVQIINDRGIHICKSMLAWQKFGNGETPASSGMKGDHLVGKYYVLFEQKFQAEYKEWQISTDGQKVLEEWLAKEKEVKKVVKALEKKEKATDNEALAQHFFKNVYKNTYFNSYSVLGQEAKEMLQKWEAEDAEVRTLWEKMNSWVYAGFEETYKTLGVDFDKLYFESQTYLTGKELVENNLNSESPIFFKKEDGSTWIDLTDAKLDQKAVLRKDGTSMYITQDMGTAQLRYQDFNMDKMVYVVGNEQEYHFKVLFEILDRLGHPYAKKCHHLSYGMVELPHGKMKSREGTVVDADDLIDDLIDEVKTQSIARATLTNLTTDEQEAIYQKVALGALKFFILKVEPKKGMTFDPQQSIDLQGQTGPYVQNAYVRTQSVQRMFAAKEFPLTSYADYNLEAIEREILVNVQQFPVVILRAAENYNPGDIANYIYELAKSFHQFWNIVKILDEENPEASSFRLDLSKLVAQVLEQAGKLIGMQMPDRM
jgi:arginyl-tRNA synthetase